MLFADLVATSERVAQTSKRSEKVQVPLPTALYFAWTVVLTAASPVMRYDALAACKLLPRRITARESAATVTVAPAPLVSNDIAHDVEPPVDCIPDVTDTSTLPEAGTVSVIAGPALTGDKTVV